jgi:hypothetical protein
VVDLAENDEPSYHSRRQKEFYLASVRGTKIATDKTKSSILSISAFCEGGKGVEDRKMRVDARRESASMKRIGMMVKVYRNESKQRINPNPIICTGFGERLRSRRNMVTSYFLDCPRYGKEIAHSLPLEFLVRVKVCGQQFLAKVIPESERGGMVGRIWQFLRRRRRQERGRLNGGCGRQGGIC